MEKYQHQSPMALISTPQRSQVAAFQYLSLRVLIAKVHGPNAGAGANIEDSLDAGARLVRGGEAQPVSKGQKKQVVLQV